MIQLSFENGYQRAKSKIKSNDNVYNRMIPRRYRLGNLTRVWYVLLRKFLSRENVKHFIIDLDQVHHFFFLCGTSNRNNVGKLMVSAHLQTRHANLRTCFSISNTSFGAVEWTVNNDWTVNNAYTQLIMHLANV